MLILRHRIQRKGKQHLFLKENLGNEKELCCTWNKTKKLQSVVNYTCSWGGDRNSFVFLAVKAADMFKACITSLYRKRWFSWSLATKSSENATMASIRCRTWQSHRYWSRWHIWENSIIKVKPRRLLCKLMQVRIISLQKQLLSNN